MSRIAWKEITKESSITSFRAVRVKEGEKKKNRYKVLFTSIQYPNNIICCR
jgi:hypothetical protein